MLPDEPLIFVEIALLPAMPAAIAPLLARDVPQPVDPSTFKVAVFYSISNCQPGLRGINLGNFLIKQVVEDLKRELPNLKTFVTLSPVPGFASWVKAQREAPEDAVLDPAVRHALAVLDDPGFVADPDRAEAARRVLMPAAAAYFLKARTPRGKPVDPVARFHLGNGARLERLNPLGDLSPKGLRQSFGLMVNYCYDLDEIEANHEAFAEKGTVAASRAVHKALRADLAERPPLATPV